MRYPKECKIHLAAAKEESRYMITSVQLDLSEPEAAVLVATDGRGLAVVHGEQQATDTEGQIPVEAIKAAAKSAMGEKGKTKYSTIECNGTAEVKDKEGNLSSFQRPTDCKFPDWRKIVPKEGKYTIGLNARKLWELAQAIGCENVQVSFSAPDEPVLLKPISIDGASDRRNYAVLMPISGS